MCDMCKALDGLERVMDYKTERGYVAQLFDGGTIALESPMFISDVTAGRWANEKIEEFLARGKRLVARIRPRFMDPNRLNDSLARMQDAIGPDLPAKGSIMRRKELQPLPTGQKIKLRVRVMWHEENGKVTVRSITPGLYDGASYTVRPDELE